MVMAPEGGRREHDGDETTIMATKTMICESQGVYRLGRAGVQQVKGAYRLCGIESLSHVVHFSAVQRCKAYNNVPWQAGSKKLEYDMVTKNE